MRGAVVINGSKHENAEVTQSNIFLCGTSFSLPLCGEKKLHFNVNPLSIHKIDNHPVKQHQAKCINK
jgi:hypothetical protein